MKAPKITSDVTSSSAASPPLLRPATPPPRRALVGDWRVDAAGDGGLGGRRHPILAPCAPASNRWQRRARRRQKHRLVRLRCRVVHRLAQDHQLTVGEAAGDVALVPERLDRDHRGADPVGITGELQVFGPHAEHDVAHARLAHRRRERRGSGPAHPALHPEAFAELGDRAGNRVHRRAADEAGHEQVGGTRVHVLRRADLLQHALLHHGDAVPHGHGLDLVVRDVDDRRRQAALQLDQLGGLHAQLGVEVRERLVHEEGLRAPHDRARARPAGAARPTAARACARAGRSARGSPLRPPPAARSAAGTLRERSGNSMFRRTVMCG